LSKHLLFFAPFSS